MLAVSNLDIERAGECLLRRVTFQLEPAQTLQISGENGAGKTSLLRTLCGFLPFRRGQIRWQGKPLNPDTFRDQVIYLGHQTPLTPQLTVLEQCRYVTAMFTATLHNSVDILEHLGLVKQAKQRVAALSAGQQRRLGFVPLVVTQRPLWILDEPFNALDTAGMEWLQQLMARQIQQAGSVIFTSHQTVAMPNLIRLLVSS